jgi:outer membrane protein
MKKIPFLVLTGALAFSVGFASQAQAQIKVGTIDMQKVFAAYYKTKEAEEKINDARKAYKDELDQRMDVYKKNLDSINKLNEEINKPELSGASKDQKAQERDSKIAEVKGLEKEINEFRGTREKQIADQTNRMRSGIVEDIMKVVNEQVKAQNYDLVFDRSGASLNAGVPVVVYAKDQMDFSEGVIGKLNANRPAPTASPVANTTQKPAAPKLAQPSPTNTPATTTKPAELNKKP